MQQDRAYDHMTYVNVYNVIFLASVLNRNIVSETLNNTSDHRCCCSPKLVNTTNIYSYQENAGLTCYGVSVHVIEHISKTQNPGGNERSPASE